MKKIIYLLLIAIGLGLYGGYALTNKINQTPLSWGTAKDAMNNLGDNLASTTTHDMMNMSGNLGMQNGDDNMDAMMKQMDANLTDKTGDDFDKEFLSEMIIHHQGAVDMAKQVLAKSKRPELLKLANDIISSQSEQINQMKNWQTVWFPNSTTSTK